LTPFGKLFSNGVILVTTKNPSAATSLKGENTIGIEGLCKSIETGVGTPTHTDEVPDLRACLYWNPKLTIKEEGSGIFSFNASDDLGNFRIEISGLSKDGQFFYAQEDFKIEYEKIKTN
jgi:hypothetical protein